MLRDAPLRFDVPVADLARAKTFYAQRLGLTCQFENDYCAQYRYDDSYFVLTRSPSAGQAEHSLLTWIVDDIERVKGWLEDRDVEFESYDFGHARTVDGIVDLDGDRVAWFRDSEGNLLAIAQLAR